MPDQKYIYDKYDKYFRNENWLEAKNTMLEIIKKERKNFWNYTSLSSCYYELRDYKNALKFSKLAYKLNPTSPLVLWDYAGVLIMLEKENKAIELMKQIITKSASEIGLVETTEGIKWANSLLNDCNFKIGLAYYRIGENTQAKRYFLKHLLKRKQGLPSLYTRRQIVQLLNNT